MQSKGTTSHLRSSPGLLLEGQRIAIFLLLLAFLNLQGDGFHLASAVRQDQFLLIPFTAFFCLLLVLLLRGSHGASPRLAPLFRTLLDWRTLTRITLLTLGLSVSLIVTEAHFYRAFGYHLSLLPELLAIGGAVSLIASNLWPRSRPSGNRLFCTIAAAYACLSVLSIESFPLNVQRSDMLPLLSAASKTLLRGQDPYRLYTFPHETVFLTYLPGTLLAFLPATLLHIDPRSLNLLYVLALATLIYRASSPTARQIVAALLGLWLLSPYLLYRHEIYTPPHWLVLAWSLLLIGRGRTLTGALLFGISIALSQFSWILLPFLLLFVLRRHGVAAAVQAALVALAASLLVLVPFVLWSPHAFFFGVLSHWQNQAVSARSVNISYWLADAIGPRNLQWAQASALACIVAFCVRDHGSSSFTRTLGFASAALAIFILGNILVWGYFFLLLEILLLLYVLSANGWLDIAQVSRPLSTPDH